jgi:hypothetical protein
MYREAIALSIRQHRPDHEVRITAPEDTEKELSIFRPVLLVRNDTDGLDSGLLAGVPCWIEVLYSDSMDARISLCGEVEEARDLSTDVLLRAVDKAAVDTQEPWV